MRRAWPASISKDDDAAVTATARLREAVEVASPDGQEQGPPREQPSPGAGTCGGNGGATAGANVMVHEIHSLPRRYLTSSAPLRREPQDTNGFCRKSTQSHISISLHAVAIAIYCSVDRWQGAGDRGGWRAWERFV